MFLRVAMLAALLVAPSYAQAPAKSAPPAAEVPASGLNGPVEVFGAANPDRVMIKTSVAGIGETLEGFDGSHGWTVNPMTGPMLKVGKELEQAKYDADFYSELRDPKKYEVKTIEKTTFEGRPCYKVSVRRID